MSEGNGKDPFTRVLEEVEKLQAATADLAGAAAAVNTSVAQLYERTKGVEVAVNALGMVLRSYALETKARQDRVEARLHAIEQKLGMAS